MLQSVTIDVTTVTAVMLASTLVTVATVAYQYWQRRHARGGRAVPDAIRRRDDAPASADAADAITCPSCGVANQRGYRYCRSCVSELPGATDRRRSGPTPPRLPG